MTSTKLLLLGALMAAPLSVPADAQRRGDADAAYQARMAGSLMPLRSIENGVVPRMKSRGADYIGAEYDDDMARYRLKFMRDGSVIWVDVDGRTGAIVGRAGE
jgi:uncharacterized membrane protein YkoI